MSFKFKFMAPMTERIMEEVRLNEVFAKGHPIPGKDPLQFRKDDFGNEIIRSVYGSDKYHEPGCWEKDHIIPKADDGPDDLRNLRPLAAKVNRWKGDKLLRPLLPMPKFWKI